MIYKHKNFGDAQYYMVVDRMYGGADVIEYANGVERTRLSMNSDQTDNFISMLQTNGWQSK
jgi:hypothetical protein